jgi:hypothetical protein
MIIIFDNIGRGLNVPFVGVGDGSCIDAGVPFVAVGDRSSAGRTATK